MLGKSETLQSFNLPQRILDASAGKRPCHSLNLKRRLEITESQTILKALECANWVKKSAAGILGVDPRNLSYFLKKHGISKKAQKTIEYMK
jgi:transcriptional regulator with GAF, ATPase, and Fis domain